MALLRNREVQILRVANEVDGSTFVVRYPDNETEMAKMNELIFTPQEYDTFVKVSLPEVNVMDQKQIQERAERTRPETKEESQKAREEALKKQEAESPEGIKPNLKPATTLQNTEATTPAHTSYKSTDTTKPSTFPDNKPATKR